MKLILIRHGDPDYANDSLTEKGVREAKLLAMRIAKWKVTDFYCSPMGRAQATASYSLEAVRRTAVTYEWMKEFYHPVTDPVSGRYGVPWDFVPSFWTNEPLMYDKDQWLLAPVFQTSPDITNAYFQVCEGLDGILARYGYVREGNFYRMPGKENIYIKETAAPGSTAATFAGGIEEDVIVIFCHLGVAGAMLSHLLGIPFPLIPQNFFLAPSSVTVLGTEERWENQAYFRVQIMGDTTHLHDGGEPISAAGSYTAMFQE